MKPNQNTPPIPAALERGFELQRRVPLFAMAGEQGERRGANVMMDNIKTQIDRVAHDHEQRLVANDQAISNLENGVQRSIDDLNARLTTSNLGAASTDQAVDPEYTRDFLGFVRSGENEQALRAANRTGRLAEINASMSVASPGDGGYLAPTEWDRKILTAQLAQSPMRRLASVVLTGVNAFSTLWDSQGWGSGWVGETAARAATTNTTFAPLTFAAGEIYAQPAVTQRLLDDSAIDLAQYLNDEVGKEFTRQENVAFIGGNGVNKPAGFLTYAVGGANAATHPGGALDTVAVAGAAAVTFDELMDFSYGLAAPYRQNASWLISSTSIAKIAKLKDSNGNYLWRESLIVGQPATLMGRPVEVDENMPAMTTGNLPIAFGDFKAGYLINDRMGMRILRDPYTNKPFVMFYCTKRVGGGVRDPRAIRLIKMA